MVSYYGEEYLENIIYTLNNVHIINRPDNDGFVMRYESNSVNKYNLFMDIKINESNGSYLFLIREMVKALMSAKDVNSKENVITEKIGIAEYGYQMNGMNKTLLPEDDKAILAHRDFEEAAAEFDAMMLYNLVFSNTVDNSVLSSNARKVAALLEFPLARSIVNDKRFNNDFFHIYENKNDFYRKDELQELNSFVIGFANNFPNELEKYLGEIDKIADGTVEKSKDNTYSDLNRLRRVFHRL